MTRFGSAAAVTGLALLVAGLVAHWPPVAALGGGIVVLVAGAGVHVLVRPRVGLERAVEPPRVQKGSPAIAVVQVRNLSRRTLPPLPIEQRLGDTPIRAFLPRLRRGEEGLRTYRLPTVQRGIYDVGPVEMPRADPFGFCRTVRVLGKPQTITVHPRLLSMHPLPTGVSRNVEGPSSDASPQGSVAFHRLREYVVGDDLRMIHWPSTAHTGQLMVRHNVDTSQPYSVVLVDLHPDGYSPEAFEEAIDVAASLVVSLSSGKAPVQLRATDGTQLGGVSHREVTPLIDYLTVAKPFEEGSLATDLAVLRRDRGGTAAVVITGRIDAESLPMAAALRRRFDRVVMISIVANPGRVPLHPGLIVVQASSAGELAHAWNVGVGR